MDIAQILLSDGGQKGVCYACDHFLIPTAILFEHSDLLFLPARDN